MGDSFSSGEVYSFFTRCISSFTAGFLFVFLSKKYAPTWFSRLNCSIIQYVIKIVIYITSWNSHLKLEIDKNDANLEFVEQEIDSIIDKVLSLYIESWYGDLSKNGEFLSSVRDYFNVIKKQALNNIKTLNKEKLLVDLIQIFRNHLRIEQDLDYDSQRNGLLAIGNLLAISNVAPTAISRCLPAKWLLIYMFERNILEVLLEKLSTSDFIYESVIQLLSERVVISRKLKAQESESNRVNRHRISFYAGSEIDDEEIEYDDIRLNDTNEYSDPSVDSSVTNDSSREDTISLQRV